CDRVSRYRDTLRRVARALAGAPGSAPCLFHPAPTFAAGENEEAMMLQSAAGDVHMPRQRRALVALTDNEVVALGLARSRFLAAEQEYVIKNRFMDLPKKVNVIVVSLKGITVLAKPDPLQSFADLAHVLSCPSSPFASLKPNVSNPSVNPP